MAFEWVHKNIKYFGGDPRRMTIFGESAGAGSVSNHLTMKKSWGLFTGAILESGSFSEWIAQPMSLAEGTYQKLLDAVSCNDVNCLLSKSSEEIFDASISIPSPDATIYGYAYQPTVDGVEIMTHPWIALANGDIADVPIMHGTNSDEGSMFISLKEDATYEELIAYWKTSGFTDDEIPLLETLYLNQSYPSVPETSQYWWAADRSVGDYIMSCPAKYTSMKLGELTQRKSSTYLYHFEHVRNKAKYVSHFSEVPFVFRWEYIGYDTVADQDTCDVMSTFWGNFVVDSKHNPSSGHVGLTDLPTWTPYTIAADNLIRIPDKEGVQMISGLKYDECEFMIARLDKAIKEDYV
jgi:carboxylesterase type B